MVVFGNSLSLSINVAKCAGTSRKTCNDSSFCCTMIRMTLALILAVTGMGVLAFGVWRMESMAPHRMIAIAILLCATGVVLIGIAAAGAGSNWGLRLATLGIYSGAGGSLGTTAAIISAKRQAGTILASLGMVTTTGFRIVSAIAVSGGLLGVVMQAVEGHNPGSLLLLVGQGLFFSTLGLQAVMIARGHWNFAEHGIIGTNVFVPWRQVSAWEWQDSNILAIALKPGLLRPRILRISIAPEGHDLVAAILASKIPS